jgi:O-antigen/teichoic acid export membrane protein
MLVDAGQASGNEYLRLFAFAIPVGTVGGLLSGATQGFGTMLPAAVIDSILAPGLRLGFAVVVLPFTRRPELVALLWLVPIVVSAVLMALALRSLMRADNSLAPRRRRGAVSVREQVREFWSFAFPQTLTALMQSAILWLDVVLLGALKGSHEAGIYGSLSRYVLVAMLGLTAIATAVSPLASSLLTEQNWHSVGRLLRVATVWATALSLPLYIVMAVFAPVLMRLFGPSFESGSAALTILALAMVANVITGPTGMILLMGGRSGLILVDSAIALALNVALNLLLIPHLGMVGAALAWAASIVSFNALTVIQARHSWGIQPFGRTLLLMASSAVLAYGLPGLTLRIALGEHPWTLIATCIAGTIGYGLAVWSLRHQLSLPTLRTAWRRRRSLVAPETA